MGIFGDLAGSSLWQPQDDLLRQQQRAMYGSLGGMVGMRAMRQSEMEMHILRTYCRLTPMMEAIYERRAWWEDEVSRERACLNWRERIASAREVV